MMYQKKSWLQITETQDKFINALFSRNYCVFVDIGGVAKFFLGGFSSDMKFIWIKI
jgi:hypothetical protein